MTWLSIPLPPELKSAKCECGRNNWEVAIDSDDACHAHLTCISCGRESERQLQTPQDIPGAPRTRKSRFIQPDRYRKMRAKFGLILDDIAEELDYRGASALAAMVDDLAQRVHADEEKKSDDPDKYREEHGKCPEGYHFNEGAGKCEKTGEKKDEPKPAEEPKKEEKPTEAPKPEEPKPGTPEDTHTIQPVGPPDIVDAPKDEKPTEEAPKPKRKKKEKAPDAPAEPAAPVEVKPVPPEEKKGLLSKIGDAFQKADKKLNEVLTKINDSFKDKAGQGGVGQWAKDAGKDLYNNLADSSVGVLGASVAVALGLNPLVAFGAAAYFLHKRFKARNAEWDEKYGEAATADKPKMEPKDLELAFKDMMNADPEELNSIINDLRLNEAAADHVDIGYEPGLTADQLMGSGK